MRVVLAPVVLIVVLLCCSQAHPIYATTAYACSRCRAVQRVTTLFGVESRRIEVTEYTRWFARSHSKHDHHWCWCGTRMDYYAS
jgi:hypothetical protein